MSLKVFYQVNEGPEQRGHSFTRNWIQALKSILGDKQVTMIDTLGTSRTVGYQGITHKSLADFFNARGSTGDPWGIIPGAGDAAESYEDTALDDPIPHGEDQGLYYSVHGLTQAGGPAYYQTRHSREFINYTGAPVNVNEYGLVLRIPDSAGTNRYFLVYREVIPEVTVGAGSLQAPPIAGQTLTLTMIRRVDA